MELNGKEPTKAKPVTFSLTAKKIGDEITASFEGSDDDIKNLIVIAMSNNRRINELLTAAVIFKIESTIKKTKKKWFQFWL